MDFVVQRHARGQARIEPPETCDEDVSDCVDCQVVGRSLNDSGRYNGRFQPRSFDLYTLQLDSLSDVTVSVLPASCPWALTLPLGEARHSGSHALTGRRRSGCHNMHWTSMPARGLYGHCSEAMSMSSEFCNRIEEVKQRMRS